MPTLAQRLLRQAEQNGWSMTVDGDLTTTSANTAWEAVKTAEGGAHIAFSESETRLGTAFLAAWGLAVGTDETIVAYSGQIANTANKIIEATP
ncbi:MAG: hypothetical protein ACJ8AI_30575 [Rhodopila sp.]